MLGAHNGAIEVEPHTAEPHTAEPHTVEPFDTVTLLTGHWASEQERPSDGELDKAWAAHFKSTPTSHQPTQTIHDTWSPSMETPKTGTSTHTTGMSSLDSRMNKVTVTSPGMLFAGTPKHSLLSDEDDFCHKSPVHDCIPSVGFTTGGGKKIKSPSKEAVEKSNSILMQLPPAGGFTTGGGKKIKSPSKEAVEKSNSILMQLGFTTGSGKKIVHPTIGGESPKRKCSEFEFIEQDGEEVPVKTSRLHAELQTYENERELTWKEALRCTPCRDIEMATLSGVPVEVCTLSSIQAADFCFSSIGFPPWDVGSAYEDLSSLEGVQKDLVSFQWVQNHYRWIIWKTASLARSFPRLLPSFTPNLILRQLHDRYLCEFVKCRRSALKLIAERDDLPGKPLVLIVAGVCGEGELEVSDGWYSVKALIDEPLKGLVKAKRLKEGQKLITCGATLSAGEPTSILDALPSTLRLSLCMNGTRRARWHTRLGYRRTLFLVKSVRSDGGRISGIEATICRRYPQCYAIEDACGNRQVYSQREYDRLMDKFGSSPSPTDMALFKNSRTTTFTRMLLNKNTLLTVWSPDTVADMHEGDVIRLFGAVPSKHHTDGHLNINTVKGTLIVKVKSGKSSRDIARTIPPKDSLPKELDIYCTVVEAPEEANQRSMSLFVQDSDDNQLCILVPKRHFDTFPRLHPRQAITLLDLLFMHYDRQKALPVYTYTERSDLKLKRPG